MPTPSWNLAIIIIFLMGIAFGYILQREKIVATLLSVYVALIVTQALSGNVISFFQGEKTVWNQFWINSHTSPFTVRVVIFLAVIMLLTAKSGISGGKSKGILSPIEIVVYSLLTTALILSSILYFLPPESREAFVVSSKLGAFIINQYIWWILLPVGLLIVTSLFRRSSSSSYD